MRVLVTGAAGLYGVHLVDALVRRDDVSCVVGVDDFSRRFLVADPFIPSQELEAKFQLIRCRFQALRVTELDDLGLDVVVHLAAHVSIPESMEEPEEYFMNNEYGTFKFSHALAATRRKPTLIYASSPEVYGNPQSMPMTVDHPLYPRSVYAVTKLAAEKHCRALYEWYRYPVIIVRNFNTYGPNQSIWGGYTAVVPEFITRALRNEPLTIHNDGKQTRDFLYVKDAVAAYCRILAAGHGLAGSIFNIGSSKQTSIIELAHKVVQFTGSSSELVFKEGRLADIFALHADISDMWKQCGWRPVHSLDEGLEETIVWYREALKGSRMAPKSRPGKLWADG